jgi:hypothetical protein
LSLGCELKSASRDWLPNSFIIVTVNAILMMMIMANDNDDNVNL